MADDPAPADPILADVVLAAPDEHGPDLALLVDGAWIEGTAISAAGYRRLLAEARGEKPPRQRAAAADGPPAYAHLEEAVIHGPTGPFRAALLRVRLAAVAAWAPGRLEHR